MGHLRLYRRATSFSLPAHHFFVTSFPLIWHRLPHPPTSSLPPPHAPSCVTDPTKLLLPLKVAISAHTHIHGRSPRVRRRLTFFLSFSFSSRCTYVHIKQHKSAAFRATSAFDPRGTPSPVCTDTRIYIYMGTRGAEQLIYHRLLRLFTKPFPLDSSFSVRLFRTPSKPGCRFLLCVTVRACLQVCAAVDSSPPHLSVSFFSRLSLANADTYS